MAILIAQGSDAALNAAWARRAGIISCLSRSARVVEREKRLCFKETLLL